ncbi:TPA: hypothetical protein ACFP30_000426 [Neisseria oralis]
MENRYTLTIYVAAPGTPTLKDGEKDTSTVGHVYYSISDGNSKMGWGFAPTISSPIWKGKVVDNEFNIYQNPVLERTMEITKKQYDALKDFGLHPDKHGFNASVYNTFSNSCVDFLYAALKEGNIYHKQVYGNDITGLVDHEGAIRVPRNIEELTNIPNPIPHSSLNKTIKRPLPEQNWSQKNILSKIDDILPSIKNIEDMPQYAQAAGGFSPDLQPLHEKARTLLTEFNQREGIYQSATEFDNTAAFITAAMQKAKMTDADVIGRMDGKLHVIHDTEELDVAIVDPKTAAQTPVADSVAQSQQTAQHFENEEQQKQYAQSQSRGMSMA